MSSFSRSSYRFTHVGMDVHKNSISVAILPPDGESPEVDRIAHDEPMVRRLVGRLVEHVGSPGLLRACYEAGPTGYGLHRLLESMGVRCEVVAPALIPRVPGDRVKTDSRDCRKLARLHRMGELVAIRVPTEAEEGVRDLCRARGDLIEDRRRARQRLSAFLLRHGVVWRDGSSWTLKHLEWLGGRRFADRAVQAAFDRSLAVVSVRDADVDAVNAELSPWFDAEPFHDRCARLVCYRGIDRIGALTLVSEVCDWRRFESARRHMAFVGLVPCEYSSGERTWRGHLTKAGNVHVRRQLVESAWAYRYPAKVTRTIAQRQESAHPDTVARAWQAQLPVPPLPPAERPQGLHQRGGRRRGPQTGRVRLGRDDRITMSRKGCHASAGDGEVTVASLARRRTAAAGLIPVKSARRQPKGREHSEGQLPAFARTAGPIREPQSGGSPTHHVPTRQADHHPRPPPTLPGSA